MNRTTRQQTFTMAGPVVGESAPHDHPVRNVDDLFAAIRRHAVGLVIWVLVCLAGAVAYLSVTPPEYSATASVILEPHRPRASGSDIQEIGRASCRERV